LTPQPIIKEIKHFKIERRADLSYTGLSELPENASVSTVIKALEKEMKKAAKDWDFEKAAKIKKQIEQLINSSE